jgi:putative molybdopterin biosynthesis protein
MGGITALKNKEAHMAPIHLLDMNTGEYNLSYIKKYLPDVPISLIKCVKRIQGFMVKKGNPFNIKELKDLAGTRLTFVNRQRGSGTRILLDYYLKKLGINPDDIKGYDKEEFTHLSVAASVASGNAQCGIGIYSAAHMLDLDFIPICSEEYDIALPTEFLQLDIIKEFRHVLESRRLRDELDKLGGYDYTNSGKIIGVGD